MKKAISTIMLIVSTILMVAAFSFYQFQNEMVSALKQHMSLLAFHEKIDYTDSDVEAMRLKEEKKRLEAEEKARKKAEIEAKKLEDKRIKEEERKAAEEKKKQEELRKKEEEAKKKEEEERRKNPPKSILLDIPLIWQLPELKNGCEITSLTMMLKANGIDVDKITLANEVKKDTAPLTYSSGGNISYWGNPNLGFVGDITGKTPGYAINPEPLKLLLQKYMTNKSLVLTGVDYSELERILLDNRTVIVWVTSDFKTPSRPAQWNSNGEVIDANFSQHTVILTGFDEKYIYYNDPLSNTKNKSIDKETFKNIWTTMGKKALSYYK